MSPAGGPGAPARVVLALGSNLGAREDVLRSAVAALDAVDGLEVTAVSPVVETDPVGPDQPDYLNAVVLARTVLDPLALLAACQAVEAAHGRVRGERWGARTLDVDVVDYAGRRSAGPALVLPHPRAHERAFVLVPWLATDPGAVLATSSGPVPVADLLARLDPAAPGGPGGVRPRPDVALAGRP